MKLCTPPPAHYLNIQPLQDHQIVFVGGMSCTEVHRLNRNGDSAVICGALLLHIFCYTSPNQTEHCPGSYTVTCVRSNPVIMILVSRANSSFHNNYMRC